MMTHQRNSFVFLFNVVLYSIISMMSSSCGIYSFTGASISPDVKTIKIDYITNQAAQVNPRLSQSFTQSFKEKFLNETNLAFTENIENADLYFSGYITGYTVSPVAAQANESSSKNRLTVSVQIDFINKKNEEQNFNSTFTRFVEFNSTQTFESIETGLVEEVSNQIIQDIFNKSIANW